MGNKICHFDKAQYSAGDEVRISLPPSWISPRLSLFRLEDELAPDWVFLSGAIVLRNVPVGNYGLTVENDRGRWEGAFDVVASPRDVIRYGFLSDFSSEEGDEADVAWMRDLHLNAAQFYDWMYRHDQLLAPTDEYADPLGRSTSLQTIQQKIEACHQMGIRAFAYGAVYAATRETFRQHPQWAMYTMDGEPLLFAGWLYYMNVNENCGWTEHLLEQYRAALQFGFDGIHMDTYGFPKWAWDKEEMPIDLSCALPRLIDKAAQLAQEEGRCKGVIFNAVNNWPTETVAATGQDTVYIEVWPPNDRYRDLYALIRGAKLHGARRVTLAAYLKPFLGDDQAAALRAFRLCWAAICASGGTQLVLGEDCGVLRDSYYANYGHLGAYMLPVVQKYCDFLVRYGELLYNDEGMDVSRTASGGINEDVRFFAPGCAFSTNAATNTVWTLLRQSRTRLTVQLINLRGNNDHWNEPKGEPVSTSGMELRLRLDRRIRGAYCASPDGESLAAVELPFTFEKTGEGRAYTVELPPLRYWNTVWVELEG